MDQIAAPPPTLPSLYEYMKPDPQIELLPHHLPHTKPDPWFYYTIR